MSCPNCGSDSGYYIETNCKLYFDDNGKQEAYLTKKPLYMLNVQNVTTKLNLMIL